MKHICLFSAKRSIKTRFLCALIILSSVFYVDTLFSQGVGINLSNSVPHTSAALDIDFGSKGLLIPRVDLTASNIASPVTSPSNSLLVYNKATAGSFPNDVTPGFYYWNNTLLKWEKLFSGSQGGWSLTGNNGTDATNNFIGTTDNIDWVVKTNDIERLRVTNSGNIGIGDPTPASLFTVGNGDVFQVNSLGDLVKINNIDYSWPTTQGTVSTILLNDGLGTLSWATPNAGTVTNVATGSGLTGGPITSTGTVSVATDGITSTHIADGTIAATDFSSMGAASGEILKWNGSIWAAAADNSGSGTVTNVATGSGLTGGPITSTGTVSVATDGITSTHIADGTIATTDLSSMGAASGEILKWNGAAWAAAADNSGSGTVTNVATGSGLTGGPITSTGTVSVATDGITSTHIADGTIATTDLSSMGAASGEILKWNGSAWAAAADNNSGGTVTSVTGTAPIVSSGGATPAISISQATTSTNGYLSSADWNTFNGKVSGSGSATRVAFWSTASTLSSNANLYWDNTNSNLGIGNASPAEKVDITGNINTTGSYKLDNVDVIYQAGTNVYGNYRVLSNQSASSADGMFINYNSTGTTAADLRFFANGTTERMRIRATDGNVGIGTTTPTHKLQVVGQLKTNGINETSDIRYKKDIQHLENSLSKIMKLNGVSYLWKTDDFPDQNFSLDRQIGVIAQEIEPIIPEVVETDNNGYKSVEYSHLVPVLIEAIKELKNDNDVLRKNLIQMESTSKTQQTQLDRLTKIMEADQIKASISK